MSYNLEKIVQIALAAFNAIHAQHEKDFELELRRRLMTVFCSDNNPTSHKTIIHG